jgi:signal transduction histidine kinase
MGNSKVRRVIVAVELSDARSCRLSVRDTGPGLPPGMEGAVFDPYVRASNKIPGLGLGLATVKRLVDAHGGRVGVAPARPSGSLFWVELPRT